MKYRKKPVVIEAHQLTPDNIHWIELWCKGSIRGTRLPVEEQVVETHTLEGEMRAEMGDYVIKGIKGEFYPCKPDIFRECYEPVE